MSCADCVAQPPAGNVVIHEPIRMDIPPVPQPFSKLQALVLHPELMNFETECTELIAIRNSLSMLEPSTNYAKSATEICCSLNGLISTILLAFLTASAG